MMAHHSPPLSPSAADPHSAAAPPLVSTEGDVRTLSFRPGEVQSEMRLSRPHHLSLAYVRAMMLFVLFVPRPRHIVMVGLGGGSLAKFCYRYFPHARITVIEVRADVIALREQFFVPADDGRFRVIHGDARNVIAAMESEVDVLLVDGFDAGGLPSALASSRFYAHCRRALVDGGVLVANVFSYDPQYSAVMGRLALMFGGGIARPAGVAGNNHIVFAVRASLAGTASPARGHGGGLRRWLWGRQPLLAELFNRVLVRAVLLWITLRPR